MGLTYYIDWIRQLHAHCVPRWKESNSSCQQDSFALAVKKVLAEACSECSAILLQLEGLGNILKCPGSHTNASLRPAASVKIPSGIWNAPTLQDIIEEAFWTLGSHRTCFCPSFLAFTSSISCSARVELFFPITNSSLA